MIANFVAADIRPGSMGRPLPGIEAALVARDDDGDPIVRDGAAVLVTDPDAEGELALRPAGRRCSAATSNEEERYRRCFVGGWYLTGDLARRDADGWFWFVGRGDDVIKSAGHLIGPFEVESALMEHPAVAEAGVIGMPDPVAGEVVKAFVRSGRGVEPSEELRAGDPRLRPQAARARRSRRARSRSPTRCPRPAAARSCAACCAPASSGCPRATSRPWRHRTMSDAAPALRHLLRQMLRVRRFEEPCVELYSAAKIRGFLHLYIGEEAVAAGVTRRPRPRRRRRRHLPRARARPAPRRRRPSAIMAEMYGKLEGCCRGRGGSMHLFDAATRFYGGNAIVAGGLPLAVGLALADKMQGRDRVTVCFFGEGAVAEGEFHECLNLAALWQLPVLFCCENNLYAMGTALRLLGVARPTSRSRRRPTRSRPGRSTAWTSSPSPRPPAAPSTRSAAGAARTSSSCAPTASARTRCSTPSCTARRPRSPAGWSATRSRRCAREPGGSPTRTWTAMQQDVDAELQAGRRLRRGRHRRAGRGAHAVRLQRAAPGGTGEDQLPRGDARGDPRGDAARRPGVPHGRGRRALRRLLRGEPRAARGVRARADPRHPAVGVGLRRGRHRRGAGRHAADRRDHDGQLQPARARPDREQRGDACCTCPAGSSTCRSSSA